MEGPAAIKCSGRLTGNWYDKARQNPKVFCGLSDVTALANAIYTKTGLVTYSGPHFTVFGHNKALEYTTDYFKKCLFVAEPFSVESSPVYYDERKEDAEERGNEGWWIMQEGESTGTIVGGNLITLNLLQGTEYFPRLKVASFFLKITTKSHPGHLEITSSHSFCNQFFLA